jgi:protein phosphatase
MRSKIAAAALTDPGQWHETNEDSVFAYIHPRTRGDSMGLLIVADGIGGHKAGEVASNLTIDTIYTTLRVYLEGDQQATKPIGNPYETFAGATMQLASKLRMAVENANLVILEHAKSNPKEASNLGSTVTCALIEGNHCVIANVGDSRTYLLRDGKLSKITEDHSYVAELIKQGAATPDAYYNHPHRNVITRSLGYAPEVEVDIFTQPLEIGDKLLLCSDGLWEMIMDEIEIAQIIQDNSNIEQAAKVLIDKANEYGGGDNIGVVLAEIQEV